MSFLRQPLAGGPGKKLAVEQTTDEGSNVVYVGRIPHGFYEKEMEGKKKKINYFGFLLCENRIELYSWICRFLRTIWRYKKNEDCKE